MCLQTSDVFPLDSACYQCTALLDCDLSELYKLLLFLRNIILMYVLCFISQKVDEQNSMDTLENDSAAAEHSLPNNSEVAEVQNCFFLRTLSCYFLADCARAISWTDDTNRFDLRLKWPQVDGGRLEHIRLDLTWLDSGTSTSNDFRRWEVAMNLRERCTYTVGYS